MVISRLRSRPRRLCRALVATALLGLSACAPRPEIATQGIEDPYEAENRRVHAFNVAVERRLVRPLVGGSGESIVVDKGARGVRNLADTLDTPRRIVNNLLQGRVEDAGHNAFRLAANLTFGLGGLLDPATELGLEARDTDFGETLHVWGTQEGPFLSVPLLGPSTTRDTVGDLVDVGLNPLRYMLPPEALAWSGGIRIAGKAAEYGDVSGAIADVLDTSADSYLIARQAWLQNRRFELSRNAARARGDDGGFATATESVDPYADAPATAYNSGAPVPVDPVVDPYEDLYAQ